MKLNNKYLIESLKEWTYPRVIQLIVGLFILTSGLMEQALGISIIGGMFTLLALLNVGCGALNGKSCNADNCK